MPEYSVLQYKYPHEGIFRLMGTWAIDTLILWIAAAKERLLLSGDNALGVREYNSLSRSVEYAELCLGIKTCIPEGWLEISPCALRYENPLSIQDAEKIYPNHGAEVEKAIAMQDITGKWSLSPNPYKGYTFADVATCLDHCHCKKMYAFVDGLCVTLI